MTWKRGLRLTRIFFLGATLNLATSNAHAQNAALDRAREYFQAGAQAYAVGEFATAVQAFEQAYQLVPRPAVLFSIAQAERKQYFLDHQVEHLNKAIDLYRRYLDDEPQGARKADAVQALSELEPLAPRAPNVQPAPKPEQPSSSPATLPTRLMITSQTPDAHIALDDKADVGAPLIREVEPGVHRILVTAPGYVDSERSIVAVKGELVTVDVALSERPARLVVVAREGALLSIDGRVQGQCPFPKPLEVPAGSHLITLTESGYVGLSREQTLIRGQTTVISARMPRTLQRTTALVMLGAAGSVATAGAVFAYFALDQQSAAQGVLEARGRHPLSSDDLAQYNSSRRDRDRLRTAALSSVGIGAALALGGAVLIALDGGAVEHAADQDRGISSKKRRSPQLSAQPTFGSGFIGLGAQGAF
jgi:hypothetical protein